MTLSALLKNSHEILEQIGVPHALIGGMALGSLGIHRATNDVDYLIHFEDKAKVRAALERTGWKCDLETANVMHFSGNGQLDFLLASRPLSKEILGTATTSGIHGVNCVRPEGLIGLKIQAYTNDRDREL